MESALLSVLPNLSVGVVSIGALVYITLQFIRTLDSRSERHEEAMKERETALRAVESEVRQSLTEQLTQNTIALSENTRALGRVVRHFEVSDSKRS